VFQNIDLAYGLRSWLNGPGNRWPSALPRTARPADG